MISVTHALWIIYGRLYDGLLSFYPYQELVRLTSEWLKVEPHQAILDLGCGTGNMLSVVTKVPGVTATGIDLSSTMIAVAKKKLSSQVADYRVQLCQGDVASVIQTLPDSSFDRIVSVNVLYALDAHERAVVWREAHRLLRPEGLMVVNNSVQTGSGGIIRDHFRHAPWWRLLRPKLLGVFLVDSLINLFGNTGRFEFPSADTLRAEAEKAGWQWLDSTRCYGGQDKGVNILFALKKR